jgi:hypothetical protein
MELTLFVIMIRKKLISELNRPTAAEKEKSPSRIPRRYTYVEITSAVS